jgi:hypothetical protein
VPLQERWSDIFSIDTVTVRGRSGGCDPKCALALPTSRLGYYLVTMITGHVKTSVANSTAYVSLVKVPAKSGEEVSGWLTGLGIASAAEYHYFRVTLDGIQVVDEFLVGSNATVVAANNGLGVALPFAKSLAVDIRDLPTASSLTMYWATYVTDSTEPLGSPEIYFDEVAGQAFVRQLARYGTEERSYTVDSLLGPVLWSQVKLTTDYFIGEEPVTGSVELWSEPGHVPGSAGSVELVVRPAGFTRELDRIPIEILEGGSADFTYDRATPGVRSGLFEIVADIPNAANKPGRYFRQ